MGKNVFKIQKLENQLKIFLEINEKINKKPGTIMQFMHRR